MSMFPSDVPIQFLMPPNASVRARLRRVGRMGALRWRLLKAAAEVGLSALGVVGMMAAIFGLGGLVRWLAGENAAAFGIIFGTIFSVPASLLVAARLWAMIAVALDGRLTAQTKAREARPQLTQASHVEGTPVPVFGGAREEEPAHAAASRRRRG